MPFTLIDDTKRSILGEGRSQGFGQGFASHKDGVITMVDPISPCKDYGNDRCLSEATGYEGTNYGLHTKRLGIFADGRAYLVIAICAQGARDPKPYPDMDKDIAALEANFKHIEAFIQWFEVAFKVEGRTTIERLAPNRFVMILPTYWVQYTYLLSLLGLLARSALYWTGAPEPMTYLASLKTADQYHLTAALPKIKHIMKHGAPAQDMASLMSPHNMGVVSFQFPADPDAVPAAAKTIPSSPLVDPTLPIKKPLVTSKVAAAT